MCIIIISYVTWTRFGAFITGPSSRGTSVVGVLRQSLQPRALVGEGPSTSHRTWSGWRCHACVNKWWSTNTAMLAWFVRDVEREGFPFARRTPRPVGSRLSPILRNLGSQGIARLWLLRMVSKVAPRTVGSGEPSVGAWCGLDIVTSLIWAGRERHMK